MGTQSDDDPTRIVALLPADGWRVEWTEGKDKPFYSEPLVGWGLRANGSVVALEGHDSGVATVVDKLGRLYRRVYHPGVERRDRESPRKDRPG